MLRPAPEFSQAALDEAVEAVGAEGASPVAAQDPPRRERGDAPRVGGELRHVIGPLPGAVVGEGVEGGLVVQRLEPRRGVAVLEDSHRPVDVAGDHGGGKPADAGAFVEAVVLRQGRHAVRQRAPVPRLAEVAEDGARLHRGQLVRVAEENQPATLRQPGRQADHERQIGHRAFVDDQGVEAVHPAGPVRQQAVNGPRLGRELAEVRHPVHEFLAQLSAHRFLDARGGLARGRRQADAARVGQARVDERRDQLGSERRLAGTGAAGDDAQPPLQGDAQRRDRLGGPVFARVEHPRDGGLGVGRPVRVRGQSEQPRREPALGVEQPVQVQAVAVQHERPVVRRARVRAGVRARVCARVHVRARVRARGDDGASSQRLAQLGLRGQGDRLHCRRRRRLRSAGVGPLHERRDRLSGGG